IARAKDTGGAPVGDLTLKIPGPRRIERSCYTVNKHVLYGANPQVGLSPPHANYSRARGQLPRENAPRTVLLDRLYEGLPALRRSRLFDLPLLAVKKLHHGEAQEGARCPRSAVKQ